MSIRTRVALLTAAAAMMVGVPGAAQRVPAATAGAPPRLVVFITVDQFRESYLEQYAGQLTGGLGRMLRRGAFFPNAYQDHAVTETAPGHSVTLSGRFPRGTGIVKNSAGVGDPQARLVGADGPGASPFRFRGSTLIDWMRTADPASRALSVSRKDRGAILPLGRSHQQVFWYTPSGLFTTSTYYADTLPGWVQRFNARREPQSYAGTAWTLLLPPAAYPERDSVPVESAGKDFVFPHVLPADPADAAASLVETPFMDQVTLDLALEGVGAMALGAGDHTDLLAVSLSTTDAIGHRYGPESREIHDQVLRVDRMLGVFMDSIFRMRDSTRVIFALTADHGVTPFPELHASAAQARAMHVNFRPFLTEFTGALVRKGVPASAFVVEDFMLTVNRPAFAAAHVNADSVIADFVARARRLPGVGRVEYASRLTSLDTVSDAVARRWVHMLPPDLPIPVVVTLKPGFAGAGTSAEHGSPYDADTHVPILFYGAPFRAGRYPAMARVVDLAPTLAAAIGVRPTERLDGHVLTSALLKTASLAAGR